MARLFTNSTLACVLLGLSAVLAGCTSPQTAASQPEVRPVAGEHAAPPTRGRLIAIGGAIRPENAAVFERFFELATPDSRAANVADGRTPEDRASNGRASNGRASDGRASDGRASDGHAAAGHAPHVLIATAASSNEPAAAASTAKTLRRYAPDATLETIGRDTPPHDAVALIDRCSAIYFTGGDQARITAKFRPGGVDGPEAAAMRRLLARGGVIAGTSAGDAMMSDPMFLGGRSPEALGIRRPPAARRDQPPTAQHSDASEKSPASNPVSPPPQPDTMDDSAAAPRDPPPLGPRLGPGMGFVPFAIMDSHFFERDRFGRLVAALDASGLRLGLGVGEDAALEIDLATGEAIALTEAPTLLVDIGSLRREGLARLGIRTRVLTRGERINLCGLLAAPSPAAAAMSLTEIPDFTPAPDTADRSKTRQFFEAVERSQTPLRLRLDGYDLTGRAADHDAAIVDIRPAGWNSER
ncbi:MAG: hypothetical protein IT450_17465 [Phycisphaerales bacterium]|nr:hypothetical protein [Phycisphaerales bacterium]